VCRVPRTPGNASFDQAFQWAIAHSQDRDFDQPLPHHHHPLKPSSEGKAVGPSAPSEPSEVQGEVGFVSLLRVEMQRFLCLEAMAADAGHGKTPLTIGACVKGLEG
jgi:hypothetical protein